MARPTILPRNWAFVKTSHFGGGQLAAPSTSAEQSAGRSEKERPFYLYKKSPAAISAAGNPHHQTELTRKQLPALLEAPLQGHECVCVRVHAFERSYQSLVQAQ